jgi:hypothetical protein
MKNEILNHLNDPRQLERLYRANKVNFRREFMMLYPELQNKPLAEYWNERLAYENDEIDWGNRREWLLLIIAIVVAGITVKLPAILSIDEEYFYPRNIGFILFPALTAYFVHKNKLSKNNIAFIAGIGLLALIFINFLPDNDQSDTLVLSCFHLLLFLWFILGFAFVGNLQGDADSRLEFMKFSGDLVVITGMFAIAGGLLTGITIGLFSLLGWDIEDFYFNYVVAFGLPAAPILGTYLIQKNPQLIGKISATIAKIFSPLVLVMLAAYLIAIVYSGKNPYNDREFLLLFNGLLVGVMTIIFYSVAESSSTTNRLDIWVLFLLSLLTIVVNGVALSAILFRITEWGFTPNRTAVLGGNIVILIHLLFVTLRLYRVLSRKGDVRGVVKSITTYLPVYLVWAIIVTFLFPFLFGFR